ncbi:MAG TPA: type IVB secretion system protein IcmH/DotU [Caulobacteraceae bacterium]|nr:type IVB secretion system protein IcmH/DotU [Caulobacteraceae bacterium]
MSDENGSGPNRTVFRPSPLQGLKANPPAAAPAGPPAGTPLGAPTESFVGAPAAPPPVEPPQGPGAAWQDARLKADDVPPPASPPKARNPMMMAAGPFLALVASVRAGRAAIALPDLHQKSVAAISAWEQAVRGRYPDEHVMRGRYALCSTIDDVALNLPGQEQDAAIWAQRSMVVRFFGENIGGDRFWKLLEEMVARPAEFPDLLELYHACLAAGFEGRYRVQAEGKRAHQEMMQRVYAALAHAKTVSATELSPHWKGEQAPAQKLGFWTPMLLAAGAASLVLLVIYIVLRVILAGTGGPALAALQAINPDQPLRLSRVAPPPPAPPESAQLTRIRAFLAPEIAQHLVTVLEDASSVRVRTTVGGLFRSASDQLDTGRDALIDRIGAALNTEPGPVRVEGYTDDDKIHSISFPDNMALSQARANTVAGLIKSKLPDPGRVSAQGYGDANPVASNDTAEGKAQNRRVEIVIQRGA